MQVTRSAMRLGGLFAWMTLCLAVLDPIGGGAAAADVKSEKPDPVATGYEIFNREWMPNDPRGHGGDGLGPVYNDSSCVACHNAGGSGGAGPVSKNIEILGASRNFGSTFFQVLSSSDGKKASDDPLTDIHAGFRTSKTVVLHKFGVDPNYDAWRRQVLRPAATQGAAVNATTNEAVPFASRTDGANRAEEIASVSRPFTDPATARINEIRSAVLARLASDRPPPLAVGTFLVNRSQRNPTALFGLGLIDAIPDEVIVAMEKQQAEKSRFASGRVSRLKDGRIGRLGWKGQIASVEDFVLNACAVEVGLEVPGHQQSMSPQAPKYRATGLDLTSDECSALVAYVKSLPRPVERRPSGDSEAKVIDTGRKSFASIGCAQCHTPDLGKVQGIYSDLLLHDMGGEMGDVGSYGVNSSDDGSEEPENPPAAAAVAKAGVAPAPTLTRRGATRDEWRTPPLWGFRDSGPYLHDGRAQTLEEAVAMHGGHGASAAQAFFALSPTERQQVEIFLKSLVAPPAGPQLARRGD
jgi:CxxC motif-containing protein (DUF1111 family)